MGWMEAQWWCRLGPPVQRTVPKWATSLLAPSQPGLALRSGLKELTLTWVGGTLLVETVKEVALAGGVVQTEVALSLHTLSSSFPTQSKNVYNRDQKRKRSKPIWCSKEIEPGFNEGGRHAESPANGICKLSGSLLRALRCGG